jgi:hypothetical protein
LGLGCGNCRHRGLETGGCVDLGPGASFSPAGAKAVGKTGTVIGVDFTLMIEKAQATR